MGTKNNPGAYDCYEKAEPDEPMFILLARDPLAAQVVRYWVALRMQSKPPTSGEAVKQDEALRCADAMDRWREERCRGS